jgi:hypothetical protein
VLTRPLAALLAAEVVSTTGSQMSSLALPWFVLVGTGSAKQMSLVLAGSLAGYALFGIPLLVLLFVPPPSRRMAAADETGGVLRGIRYLLTDRLLQTWTAAFAIGDAAFRVIFAAIPVLVVRHYDANSRLAGILFACWGLGAVAGNAASYRLGARGRGLGFVAVASPVQALPLWVLAVPTPAWAAALGLVTSGVSNGLVNPTLHSLFTLRPPVALRPQVMTVSTTASTVAAPAALLLAAPLFDVWGVRPVLAAAVAGQTIAVVLISLGAIVEARAAST